MPEALEFLSHPWFEGCVLALLVAAAWRGAPSRRRLLLVLAAAWGTWGAAQMLSRLVSIPEPAILATPAYRFERGQLRPYEVAPGWAYRRSSADGYFAPDRMESFPDPDAALYGALAFGLLLINRRLGTAALGWTLAVVVPVQLLRGVSSVTDVAGGLGLAFLAIVAVWLAGARPVRGHA